MPNRLAAPHCLISKNGDVPMRAHRLLPALVIACWLVAPVGARGPAWKHITTSADGLTSFYMDAKGSVAHGSTRRVRLLFDFSQLQQDPDTLIEHRSMVETASIDCRRRTLATIEATSYAENMGRGRAVVTQTSPQPLKQVVAAPESIDERVINFVCDAR
jgi:hypothetical protein